MEKAISSGLEMILYIYIYFGLICALPAQLLLGAAVGGHVWVQIQFENLSENSRSPTVSFCAAGLPKTVAFGFV